MAKIILDKNLATKVEVNVDTIYERIVDNQLNCMKTVKVESASDIPTLPALSGATFTTINAETDDGIALPIVCNYNVVALFQTNYYEKDKTFSYNINFEYKV